MTEEVFIPKFGQTVEEVTLVNWLVKDGEKLDQGQGILEVETDKAVFTVEANAKGYIHIGPYKAGQIIPVLTVVALIGGQEEKFEKSDQSTSTPELVHIPEQRNPYPANREETDTLIPKSVSAAGKIFITPRAKKIAVEKKIILDQVTASGFGGIRIVERDLLRFITHQSNVSPLAKKMAMEHGIPITNISGSGPNGRVVKNDILAQVQKMANTEKKVQIDSSVVIKERIPLTGVRKLIADRMGSSVHTTARVTLFSEVDATEFVKTRTRLKEKVEKEWGFAPGYNDLLAKIVSAALRQCPYMNARLTSENIEILENINLGIAVDTERGLLVPVVQRVETKNLRQFGMEFREMVDRARNNRSLPDDLTGGTFTITNLGNYDVDAFTPVINLPEAAILGVGRISPKVVPCKGEIVIRDMVTLSLVFDHRLIDGAPAARFLQIIKKMIEEPFLLLAS